MALQSEKLRERLRICHEGMAELSIKAETEDRSLTEEEQKEYDGLNLKCQELEERIARAIAEEERERQLIPSGSQSGALASTAIAVNNGPAWQDDPCCGFKTPREFLQTVLNTGMSGRITDERLKHLHSPQASPPSATAGSDEAGVYSDPYGGFLLPKGFMPNLLQVAAEADPFAGRVTEVPMDVAVLDIPARVDKNHSNSVSGGLRVYRRAETDTVTTSRMEFEQVTLRAHALFGLSYATEEILARSPISFVALLAAGFGDEFTSKLMDERLNGSGVGMYEGVMNTPCKIAVTKETGQAADSIVYENIVKMRAQCWRFGQAIWLANHDTLPQLATLTLSVGTGGVPMWQPSAREDEPDLLWGRPVFFTEYCKTVGDEGDLLLGNWSQYLEGTLSPLQEAQSIHVRFIYHERTFKFWMENDGRCWWRSYLTPKNSTNYLSPFVTLEARA